MGCNISECWHGVILMMQCLRHIDRFAVGGQAWIPGRWCLLLTDIDFSSAALCGCVGDYRVLLVDMWRVSDAFMGLRPPTPWHCVVVNMSWLETGPFFSISFFPTYVPYLKLCLLISVRTDCMHSILRSFLLKSFSCYSILQWLRCLSLLSLITQLSKTTSSWFESLNRQSVAFHSLFIPRTMDEI